MTVGNGQNMKYELKGTVNMKLKGVENMKLTEVLYVPQPVKNMLSISIIVSKGSTMRANKEKITTNKNVSI